MNTNQILDNGAHANGLSFTPAIRIYLTETARWSKFLAILGFISIGLLILGVLVMGGIMGFAVAELVDNPFGALAGVFLAALYLGIAVVDFFPCLYLYRFATLMQIALTKEDNEALNEAFKNMKSVYRFLGIVTLIFFGIYALTFVLSLFTSLFAAF